jgi:hypothetical protein
MPARLRRGRTSEELSLPSPSEELLRRRFGEAGFAVLSFRDGWSSTRRLADVAGTDQRAGGRGSPLQSAVPWEQRWFYSVALLVLLCFQTQAKVSRVSVSWQSECKAPSPLFHALTFSLALVNLPLALVPSLAVTRWWGGFKSPVCGQNQKLYSTHRY